MGRAAAIAYAREGADVAINYLPAEEADAKEVLDLIKQAGRKGVGIPGDLRTEGFCKQLVAEAIQKLGGLDILVCNAARQQARPSILDVSRELLKRTRKVPPAEGQLPIEAGEGGLEARVRALEENERRQAELIKSMADQLAQLATAATVIASQALASARVGVGGKEMAPDISLSDMRHEMWRRHTFTLFSPS